MQVDIYLEKDGEGNLLRGINEMSCSKLNGSSFPKTNA